MAWHDMHAALVLLKTCWPRNMIGRVGMIFFSRDAGGNRVAHAERGAAT